VEEVRDEDSHRAVAMPTPLTASSTGRRGRLSAHFDARELACPHCGVCVIRDRLLVLLERVRAQTGKPLRVISGYRCPVHNRAAGGASNSMHMYGAAADLPAGVVSVADAASFGAVGIGTKDGRVVHIDVRDGAPARWTY
jgi:zinc D-Ala-D-Ala carboxypeptidase